MMVTYNKQIIAKYNKSNHCLVDDGIVLYIKPLKIKNLVDHKTHHFISCIDNKSKSKYGWVEETDEFTLSDFIQNIIKTGSASDDETEAIRIMLDSISKLPKGTPVAATYSCRGIEQKKMVLTVHKVFFYKE